MRVYLERFEPDPARQDVETHAALGPLIAAAERIAGIGRYRPDATDGRHLSEGIRSSAARRCR